MLTDFPQFVVFLNFILFVISYCLAVNMLPCVVVDTKYRKYWHNIYLNKKKKFKVEKVTFIHFDLVSACG